jgi:thioredoxin-related protein
MKNYKKNIPFFILIGTLFIISNIFGQTSSFNDALKKAKDEDKKLIVDVYTDWCGWCKKMDADAYQNKGIKKIIKKNFVFVKLNAEGSGSIKYNGKEYTETDLALLFQVSGYPTTVFLEPDGKVIEYKYDNQKMNNLPGYFKTSDFKKILEYIANEDYNDTDLSTIVN